MVRNRLALALASALLSVSAAGVSSPPRALQETQAEPTGQVATSAVGRVGERRTNAQARGNVALPPKHGARIGNRVQNRIRNRIDRYYDPKANATAPFKAAEDQVRAGPPR